MYPAKTTYPSIDIVGICVTYRLPAHATKNNTIRDWTAANVNGDSGAVSVTTVIVEMSAKTDVSIINSLSLSLISSLLPIYIRVLLFVGNCTLYLHFTCVF